MFLRSIDNATEQTTQTTATRESKRFQRLFLFVSLLVCTLATSMNVADPDIWGHVQYGQDVIRDGSIPGTNTYSFTAPGYRWINHENIAELVFASLAGGLGQYGLLAFKFLLSVAVFWSIITSARSAGAGLAVTGLIAALSAISVSLFWSFRPQLFSFAFYVLMVILLNHAFQGWRDQWHLRRHSGDTSELTIPNLKSLWFAPILFFFWANAHGAFVAGICLFTAYLVLRSIEIMVRMGPAGLGLVMQLAAIALVTMGATLINPYGYDLHLWLLHSLREPRPEILDWASTDFLSAGGIRFACVILLTLFSFSFSNRQKDFTHIVILTITAWQAVEHFRHAPFFIFAAAFWIPVHLQSAIESMKKRVSVPSVESRPQNSKLVLQTLMVVALVLVVLLGRQLMQIKVDREKYPVSAIQFMKDHDIHGRMVVNFSWAQYALAALCATERNQMASTISFDGRFRTCYPQEIVDQHFDFMLGDRGSGYRYRSPDSPPLDTAAVLYRGQPEIVVISRHHGTPVAVMQQQTNNWCLLYQDNLAQVWGLRIRFDNLQSPYFVPPEMRRITDDLQSGAVSWPAFPLETPRQTQNSRRQIADRAMNR